MATIDSVLTKIRNLISRSNTTTGRTDTDLNNAVNALIGGYMQGGITPSGTLKVTANGIYDCEKYVNVEVAVPASGITPSGTKEIESNGTLNRNHLPLLCHSFFSFSITLPPIHDPFL